ncbi:hypothetical protein K9F17_16470, partial [Stenotrophomonas acidaminiphila]|nr:hypothetical protein [Stenotrophomonas acidaminiphila]
DFAVNVHASLLPRHRGGAPIHYALIQGDEVPVRRATISLSLPLTILISSVRLKTVYPQTVLIRYLTIVRLGNRYWVHR